MSSSPESESFIYTASDGVVQRIFTPEQREVVGHSVMPIIIGHPRVAAEYHPNKVQSKVEPQHIHAKDLTPSEHSPQLENRARFGVWQGLLHWLTEFCSRPISN